MTRTIAAVEIIFCALWVHVSFVQGNPVEMLFWVFVSGMLFQWFMSIE